MHRIDFPVGQHLLHRGDIDAVAAEDPHLPPAVFIEVIVVGIGEMAQCRHLIIRGHVGDGIARDDPEEIPRGILLDPQYNVRSQAVLSADMPDARPVDDIDAPAVRAQDDVAVWRFRDREDFRVGDAVLFAVSARDPAVFNDVYAAGIGNQQRSVPPLTDDPNAVGEQPVFLSIGGEFAFIITQQAVFPPGGKPQPSQAVADDGADAAAFQHLQKIRDLQIDAGRAHRLRKRRARHSAGSALVQHGQPRIRSNEQQCAGPAGGIDHHFGLIVYLG